MPHQGVHGVIEVVDHAGMNENMGHEGKQRYGRQHVDLELAVNQLADAADLTLGNVENSHGGGAQAGEYRHAGEQQQQHANQDQDQGDHDPSSRGSKSRRTMPPSAVSNSNPAPTGTANWGIHIGTSR